MKKIILLFLFAQIPVLAQDIEPVTKYNFELANGELFWQKVFEPNLENEDLISSFRLNVISTINIENLQELDNRLTFIVLDDKIDFKSYGGSWGNTAIFVQYPIKYLVMVDFKEKRYRVTVKNIFSDMREVGFSLTEMDDIFAKKNKTIFRTSETVVKGIEYFHLHFLNKFDISKIKNDNDKW